MPTAFQVQGAQNAKPTRYAPIWTNRFWTGLWTQRNPLRDAATPYLYEKFYSGSRYDSLIDGQNVEVTSRLTLARAPGSSVYNSQTFPPIDSFYEFRQFTTTGNETISIIADTATTIYDATGPSTQTTIFAKSTGAGQAYFQSVGNTLYFGDGIDQEKYINIAGAWTTQLWGIAINSANVASGPNNAGLGADVVVTGSASAWANPTNIQNTGNASTVTLNPSASNVNTPTLLPTIANQVSGGGGTNNPWVNINNILSHNNVFAVTNMQDGETTKLAQATGFHCNIPTNATIKGITVTIWRMKTPFGGTFVVNDSVLKLLKSGSPTGTNKAVNTDWPTSNTAATYGGSSDLWGTTWTPAQINTSTFGAQLSAVATQLTGFNVDAKIDSITVVISYSLPAGNLFSDLLEGTTYGFGISSVNAINGIAVKIKGFQTGAGGSATVRLLKNGVQVGTPKQNVQLPGSNNFITLGGSSDLWGTNWFPADVDLTNFGVAIQAINTSITSQTWNVYLVQVTIYSFGVPTVTTAVGTLSPTKGYNWVYSFGNSYSGHVSTATQTFGIGAQTAKEFQFTVTASTDPQVNQIRVFRTTDGGVTLFEIPTSPYTNATQTVTDNAPDSQLNLFSQAPINDSNDPPPSGIGVLTYHLGRVWGAVGNTVFYSQASLGAVPGVTAESWPPLNFFTFPSLVNRLFPCAVGLMVFTTSDVYLIPNITTSPYFGQPYPYISGLGLLSFNAFTVNGTNPIIMTSDNQVVAFDPTAGLIEWGFPIGDIFESAYSSSTAYMTWHVSGSKDKALYASDGAIGWYRLNPVSAPEQGLTWSPQRQIVGGTSAVQSVETSPGLHSLLIGPASSGPILQRDYSTHTDNGTPYQAFATLGSIVLAHPGQKAILDFITTDCTNQGSVVSPSVLIDEVFGTFETLTNPTNATDPPDLPASTSLSVNRWYFTTTMLPAECRHLQIMLSWPIEDAANELYSYSLFGAHYQEK